MWIVKIDDYSKHSAWSTKEEAIHQAMVLKDYGYLRRGIAEDYVEFDETINCENGYYYV